MNAHVQTIAESAFRLAEFQNRLSAMDSDAQRKEAIMAAYAWALIDATQAMLLIQVYQLEEA